MLETRGDQAVVVSPAVSLPTRGASYPASVGKSKPCRSTRDALAAVAIASSAQAAAVSSAGAAYRPRRLSVDMCMFAGGEALNGGGKQPGAGWMGRGGPGAWLQSFSLQAAGGDSSWMGRGRLCNSRTALQQQPRNTRTLRVTGRRNSARSVVADPAERARCGRARAACLSWPRMCPCICVGPEFTPQASPANAPRHMAVRPYRGSVPRRRLWVPGAEAAVVGSTPDGAEAWNISGHSCRCSK
eukprot:353669-Chlamydomonas_euryale.AAC.2